MLLPETFHLYSEQQIRDTYTASFLQTEGKKNKIRIARRASWNCNSQFSRRKPQVDDVSSETAFLTVNSKYVYRYTAPFLQTEG